MALATRCPYCNTTFRVAHDQLKLRAGLVRCGACKEIFNGIEHLLRPQEIPGAQTPAPISEVRPSADDAPSAASINVPTARPDSPVQPVANADPDITSETVLDDSAPTIQQDNTAANTSATVPARTEVDDTQEYSDFFEFLTPKETTAATAKEDSVEQPPSAIEPAQDDPLLRMTLIDISGSDTGTGDTAIGRPERGANIDEVDPLEQVINDLQHKPRRRPRNMQHTADDEQIDSIDDETEEPSFVTRARHKQRFGRAITFLMAIGSMLLLIALIAQAAYAFRNQLAARYPQVKPVLVRACTFIKCRVSLPMQIEAISIESNELQALPSDQDVYTLTTLLRNRAPIAQRWPNIELTLNDAQDKAIARRVFTPREYLATAQENENGFAPVSEHAIKLTFKLTDLKPAGYRVYLFYP